MTHPRRTPRVRRRVRCLKQEGRTFRLSLLDFYALAIYLAAEMVLAAFQTSIYQPQGQRNLSYTPEFIADLDRTISRARLARFMTAAGGNIELALHLYEKNLELSEALFGLLHGLEIAVRNSIHHVLSVDIGRQDWYRDGHPLPFPAVHILSFTRPMNSMITDARSNAGTGAPVGKVIAELTFGFWPNMITSRFEDLWRASLNKAFPSAHVPRKLVHWRLETIRRLRNRIAHHEAILTSRNQVYTGFIDQPTMTLPAILECVTWVSPPTADWLRTTTRYPQATTLLAEVADSGVVI